MPWVAAVLNHERKSSVSMVYPCNGKRANLTRKETVSVTAKRTVSLFCVKLTVFPSVSLKGNTYDYAIRTFLKNVWLRVFQACG